MFRRKLLLLLFWAPAAFADPTVVSAVVGNNTADPPNHTWAAGSNRIMLLYVGHKRASTPLNQDGNCTYRGVNMIHLGAVNNGSNYLNLFGLLDAAAEAGTGASFDCTWPAGDPTTNTKTYTSLLWQDAGQDLSAIESSFTGASTATTPYSSPAISTSVTGVSNSMGVAGCYEDASGVTGFSWTNGWSDASGQDTLGANSASYSTKSLSAGSDSAQCTPSAEATVLIGAAVVRAPSTPPAFSSGPTATPAANGYTISGTVDADATVYAAACLPSRAAPSAAQLIAGNCGDDIAADISANEAWTATVGDSFALTVNGAMPRHDVYVVANNVNGSSAVSNFDNQDRSPDTGQEIFALTSISTTSIFALQSEATCDTTDTSDTVTGCADTSWIQPGMLVDLSSGFARLTDVLVEDVTADSITFEIPANASVSDITITQNVYFVPTVAVGDVVEADSETSHTDVITWGVDGDFSYTDTSGGQLTTIDYCIQDVSDTSPEFNVTECGVSDDTIYIGKQRPELDLSDLNPVVLTPGEAMSIALGGYCTDSDDLPITITNRAGNTPSGTTITDGDWAGEPDTEDEAGVTLDILCGAEGELYDAKPLDVYTVTTVTWADQTTGDQDAVIAWIKANMKWRDDSLYDGVSLGLSVFPVCSDEAANEVISQNPPALTEITAYQSVSVNVSTGSACPIGGPGKKRPKLPVGVSIN